MRLTMIAIIQSHGSTESSRQWDIHVRKSRKASGLEV